MKKVLSLVLALVMVLGMTTVGFAKTDYISNYDASDASKSNMLKVVFTEDGGSTWNDSLVLERDMQYGYNGLTCDGDDVEIRSFDNWMYKTSSTDDDKKNLSTPGSTFATVVVRQGTSENVQTTSTPTTVYSTGSTGNETWYAVITEAQAKRWDLGLNLTNSTTFKKAEIKYTNWNSDSAGNEVIVQFVLQDYLTGTSKKKTEDTITAKADGKNVSSSKAKITTYLKNGEEKVEDKDDETADLSGDKKVLNPKVSIAKIEIDLSEDAVLYTRIFSDKKIYANVIDEVTDLTMAISDKYGFARSYRFLQTGVVKDASTIQFDEAGMYVYAIDNSSNYDPVADSVKLIYVGKGDAKLPIYEYYFFSLKELTLATEAPAEEPPVETGTNENPAGTNNVDGGPTGAVGNTNYNPGTGR